MFGLAEFHSKQLVNYGQYVRGRLSVNSKFFHRLRVGQEARILERVRRGSLSKAMPTRAAVAVAAA